MGKHWLIAAAVYGLVIGFQNCTGPGSTGKDRHEAAKGGDGYTGKVTYVHLSKDQPCPGGTQVKGEIEFTGTQAFLTKENCAPVYPPRPLPDAQFMPYNPGVIMLGPQLFERHDVGQFSDFACRGQATYPDSTGRIGFADIQLYDTGTFERGFRIYGGVIRAGYFDTAGNLVTSQTFELDRAETDPSARSFRLYHPNPAPMPSMLMLGTTGATLGYHSSSFTPALLVPEMTCSFHE